MSVSVNLVTWKKGLQNYNKIKILKNTLSMIVFLPYWLFVSIDDEELEIENDNLHILGLGYCLTRSSFYSKTFT